MERKWWKESVVYQIYPRSFMDSDGDGIGDLNGVTLGIPYLKELGVDVIWMSPVYESPNEDNGYDISNYQAIMKDFGSMEDFDRLLLAAHENGIRIVMDLVVNHTSDEHPWFVESRGSKESPYRDYYIWREGRDGKEPNNWGSSFGGSAWQKDGADGMYYLHLFSAGQPDLNWENEKVRDEIYRMMEWWCQKGIDGFRMDVINMISKVPGLPDGLPGKNGCGDPSPFVQNGPHVHEYLQEMNRRVLSKHDLLTVGECSGVTVDEALKYACDDGKELSMVFQFEHMDLDGGDGFKWSDRKVDLRELKQVMSKWQTGLYGKAWNSLYWCNHDQPRIVSRFGDDSLPYRELSAKMLATCLHMMQGTPYIYQGEELGMTNYPFRGPEDFRDIESINAYRELVGQGVLDQETMLRYLRYKSRDNARTPFQWDGSENAGFTGGTPWINVNPNYTAINAKEQLGREDSVFHYYQKLIRLRKEHDIIVYGKYALLMPEHRKIYAYERTLGDERLLVACNFSGEEQELALPGGWDPGEGRVWIGNYELDKLKSVMSLRPYEAFAAGFRRRDS